MHEIEGNVYVRHEWVCVYNVIKMHLLIKEIFRQGVYLKQLSILRARMPTFYFLFIMRNTINQTHSIHLN